MAALEDERVKEGSDGLPAKLFCDRCVVNESKMDKAMAETCATEKVSEIQTPFSKGAHVKTGKAAAAIQMDKATMKGEKPASGIDKIQTDVQCAPESDPRAGPTGKMQLPDQYVSYILAMPVEKLEYPDMPSYLRDDNMADYLGVTEEWLEDQRQAYMEGAIRSQRIHNHFTQFQAKVRDELFEKGYVEVDNDYFTNMSDIQEEGRAMWEEVKKKRDPTITFVKYSDSVYDYEGQARRLVPM